MSKQKLRTSRFTTIGVVNINEIGEGGSFEAI